MAILFFLIRFHITDIDSGLFSFAIKSLLTSSYPGIEKRIGYIHEKIDKDKRHGNNHYSDLYDRVISGKDGVHYQSSEPRPAEYTLRQYGSAKHVTEL